jgi:membrane protease YdiL (CAAX protease family)
MRSIARRHPFAVFLTFAYGISALAFALPLLSNAGLGVIDVALPGAAPFILISAIGLAVAAFAATALADGREGVRELRRRTFRFRVKPAWYAVALLLLPGTAFAAAVVVAGIDPIVRFASNPVILAGIVVGAIVAFALVNWWEETAWTGFALARLQDRMGPIGASVVTTWLQALVHVPLVFVADGVTVGRVAAEQIPFYLVALFVLPIPVRIVLTWVYNASGRSLPIVGLYHAGLGVATGAAFLPVLAPGIAPVVAYAGFAVLAAIVVVATHGRLGLMRPDRAEPAPTVLAA